MAITLTAQGTEPLPTGELIASRNQPDTQRIGGRTMRNLREL